MRRTGADPRRLHQAGLSQLQGRINCRVYWLHHIMPLMAASIGAAILDTIVFGHGGYVLSFPINIASLVPNLAAGVTRCHDRGRSGWFLLAGLIPLIGQIWVFIEIGFLRGTPGPNRFGPDPLAGSGLGFQYRPAPV